MDYKMFCYQCQETANCSGCTVSGVCGKKPDTANMQDLLVYITKGISAVTTQIRAEGKQIDKSINHLITLNLFTTITNANFDKDVIVERIKTTLKVKENLLKEVPINQHFQAHLYGTEMKVNLRQKRLQSAYLPQENEDIRSLRELITYGLKGLSAYSKHANVLMNDNEELDAFLQRALSMLLDDTLSVDDLVALTLETGKFGVDGMAMLDKANTSAYGNPEITKVNIGVRSNLQFLFRVTIFEILKCF